jgi:hypothetical protein
MERTELRQIEGDYNPDCDISNPADDTIDILDAEIVFRNWLAGR